MGRWPHRVLAADATTAAARRLATRIVEQGGPDPMGWLRPARFQVKVERLGGGLQGLCIPMDDDRFRFVICRDLSPEARTFVVCHEAAHTFFYFRRDGQRPRRAVPVKFDGSGWEERFCDAFAFKVTGVKRLPQGLEKVAA